MISLHIMSILSLFLLAIQHFSAGLVIESERLRNFHDCTPEQQIQVHDSWMEAMSIDHTDKDGIDCNHNAEREFFDPEEKMERENADIIRMFSLHRLVWWKLILHSRCPRKGCYL